jgi:tetratricopeptide (TPR) repeat protein
MLVRESTDPKRTSVEAVARVEELIPVLVELRDEVGMARAHRLLGDMHWARARYAAAQHAYERSVEHARRAGALWEENEALGGTLGSGAYGPAPASEVALRCEEILAAGRGVGSLEAGALRALAWVRAMQGHIDEARELGRRGRSILEELGLRLRAVFMSETLGSIEILAGDLAAAEREYRAGYDAAAELGERGFLSTVAASLAHVLVSGGRLQDAEVLTRLSEDVGAEDDLATQVTWRSARARILAATGDQDQAVSLARESVTLAEETDDLNMRGDTLVHLGGVLQGLGRDLEAAEAFGGALERYEAKGNVVGAADVRRRLATLDAPV